MTRAIAFTALFAAAGVTLGAAAAMAQAPAYPTKPIRIVVPYAPGGATDIVARIIAEPMRQALGQPVVVESKVGGNGIVALDEMLKSKDGYTLMVGNVTTNAIMPATEAKKLRFDYGKDVVAIQRLADIPAVLVVSTTNFAPRSVKEIVDYAKKNPGKVRAGTVGAGSYPHYDAAFFGLKAGIDLNMIHNKAGAAGVINDLVTGDTQIAFLNAASTRAMVQAGKMAPAAVVNTKRLELYPDKPTMAEAGYADVGTIAWQGLFAPAATPKPILDALFKASTSALDAPAAKETFSKQNFIIVTNKTLDESAKWIAGELERWKKIAAQVKIEN
jgi:tripartite-type tricarboxylate transporter receptor subunit TctC